VRRGVSNYGMHPTPHQPASHIRRSGAPAPDGSGKTDAIRVTLEENEGEAVNVFMPYRKRLLRGIEYGEIFASAADKSVFV